MNTITKCNQTDFKVIHLIINDAAIAYKGVIPADRWSEPYMTEEALKIQIDDGVEFWAYVEDCEIKGVMGIQLKGDVTLIRHAYVRSKYRNKGIGGKLLKHLYEIASTPVLIGTWAAATWAIDFYLKHGFRLLPDKEAAILLRTYWAIPTRQLETSVVLASSNWNGIRHI